MGLSGSWLFYDRATCPKRIWTDINEGYWQRGEAQVLPVRPCAFEQLLSAFLEAGKWRNPISLLLMEAG
jgi:hypothetical protein